MMVSADGGGWVRVNAEGDTEPIDEKWLPSARDWGTLAPGNDSKRTDDET